MAASILIVAFAELLIVFADLTYKRSRGFSITMLTTCILFLSFFAGVRDNSCGIDIKVYEEFAFRQALFIDNFADYSEKVDLDLFFMLINYAAAAFNDKIGVAFFLIEFFVSLFSIMACYTLRKKVPMWISALPFLLCLYPLSYNLMRQCIAIAFLSWSFAMLIDSGNLKRFIIMVIIGAFFHKTSVLAGLPIAYIYWAANLGNETKTRTALLLFVAGSATAVVMANIIFKIIAEGNPVIEHFTMYFGGKNGFHRGFVKPCILLDFMALFVCLVSYKMRLCDTRLLTIYSAILYLDLLFQSLGAFSVFATRLGMYTSALHMFVLPQILMTKSITRQTSYCLVAASIACTIAFALRAAPDTGYAIPYKSEILGI